MMTMTANIEPLLEKLRSGSPILQRVAINELRLSSDPQFVEPLADIIRTTSRAIGMDTKRQTGIRGASGPTSNRNSSAVGTSTNIADSRPGKA